MPIDNDTVISPVDRPQGPPSDNKGGPGTYDGEKGYPGRTGSDRALPEKVRDNIE